MKFQGALTDKHIAIMLDEQYQDSKTAGQRTSVMSDAIKV